ncbi:MAG: Mu-like prophage major head subunit gpT family protein [Solidesulfovibrio sp. DCME]|uniref:Mu-like prophage major head subunit gpT family protein n=1 Tax=Solidesulfovibrio sp. DCME TaxID=3447380 RepID=UPI003D0A6DA4
MIINSQSLVAARTGFKMLFQSAFDGAQSDYDKVAMTVPSTKAQEVYPWLGKTTTFREWVGDRVVQNLASHDFTIKNRSFENTVGVDRDDIEDDSLGVYSPLFTQLGQDAKTHPDTLVFALLAAGFNTACYDGQYFFDTDHPVGAQGQEQSVSNYGGGAGTAWYLLDATRAIRPFIFQTRRSYQFVAMDLRPDQRRARVAGRPGPVHRLGHGQRLDGGPHLPIRAASWSVGGDHPGHRGACRHRRRPIPIRRHNVGAGGLLCRRAGGVPSERRVDRRRSAHRTRCTSDISSA